MVTLAELIRVTDHRVKMAQATQAFVQQCLMYVDEVESNGRYRMAQAGAVVKAAYLILGYTSLTLLEVVGQELVEVYEDADRYLNGKA